MTMSIKSSIAATALILAMGGTLVSAQTPTPTEPNKPTQGASQNPSPSPSPAQSGMRGMPMNMMGGGMMNMMQMMHGMGMAQRGGMAMIDHIEGRIAFLRAELKISDAQATAWNAFAEALRANAKKLAELRPAMGQGATGQQQQSLGQRLESQERWLLARYEGIRAIRSAFTALYGTFSDEQKKSADELLAPHMGMRMMTMAPGQSGQMMRGQTQPGQTQPGQMMPGQMQPGQMMPGAR